MRLAAAEFAGVALVQLEDRGDRRRRAAGPDGIDRIVLDRNQLGARLRAGRTVPFDLGLDVQRRIMTDALTCAQVLAEPFRRGLLDQMAALEQRRVELRLRLDGIAAVDEHRGALRKHDEHAGRAGKPRQPGEALRARGHVFVAMLVGQRHDEAVQVPRPELLAQPVQPLRERRLLDRNVRQFVLQPQQTGAQLVRLGERDEIQPGVRLGAGRSGDDAADQLTNFLYGPNHARCRQQPRQFGLGVACGGGGHRAPRGMRATWAAP